MPSKPAPKHVLDFLCQIIYFTPMRKHRALVFVSHCLKKGNIESKGKDSRKSFEVKSEGN